MLQILVSPLETRRCVTDWSHWEQWLSEVVCPQLRVLLDMHWRVNLRNFYEALPQEPQALQKSRDGNRAI